MKSLAIAAIALLCCLPVMAQSNGGASGSESDGGTASSNYDHRTGDVKGGGSQGSGGKTSSGQTMSMTGCITEREGKYVMMSADHPTGVELMSKQDLKPHVGHTVTVMGMMNTANSSTGAGKQRANGTSGAGSAGAGSGDTGMMPMQVTSLKMVSKTCNAGSTGTSGNLGASGTGYGSAGDSATSNAGGNPGGNSANSGRNGNSGGSSQAR